MQPNHEFIVELLSRSSNGNLPETKLFRWYGQRFALSTFDAALVDLIDAGLIERVPPLHVKLK
ncbi:hypothetical protein [Burkholderia ubonensis]|uniref:hypothetical protein n=1 Tax=Burkholderia ubonensis TaxID=101571 RepID=UPI000A51EC46|nr:hypothetical protein [Burkholderia ubonensis]